MASIVGSSAHLLECLIMMNSRYWQRFHHSMVVMNHTFRDINVANINSQDVILCSFPVSLTFGILLWPNHRKVADFSFLWNLTPSLKHRGLTEALSHYDCNIWFESLLACNCILSFVRKNDSFSLVNYFWFPRSMINFCDDIILYH